MNKPYRITVNVKYSDYSWCYRISRLNSPDMNCGLCRSVYRRVIGEEVTGKVTFVLRKIKGRATDYIHPFRIINNDLEIHNGKNWDYAKTLGLLAEALDANKLRKWAGNSTFSMEMEYMGY